MLYNHDQEKDNCGFGMIAQIDNQPSHEIVTKAINALARLTHRGAISADGLTGDGCGVLLKMPDKFLRQQASKLGIRLGNQYAVGIVFFPNDAEKISLAKKIIEQNITKQNMVIAGWRDVPVDASSLGEDAKLSQPYIAQVFVNFNQQFEVDEAERNLFLARQTMRHELRGEESFYVASLSTQTIIYKGLMMPANLPKFYPDLNDADMQSSLVIFHQRFSTNTASKWELAQPFRMLAHNGEINTINSNRSWARSRLVNLLGERFPELSGMRTVVNETGSDSSSLDNMLELLVAGGMDMQRAIRLLIPPAWQNVEDIDADLRAFYEYNSMHMEPWDGPAGVVLTDGRFAGCTLDRNGLRPARYVITNDRQILIASENGTCDIPEADIIEKGRICAGELLLIDLEKGEILYPQSINESLKTRAPFRKWLKQHTYRLRSIYQQDTVVSELMKPELLACYEKLFDVTKEEKSQVIRSMVEDGQEPIGSMGDDTPLAILSSKHRPLYDYFRQMFAQVTNPPIDPLRESLVMSLQTMLGSEYCLFKESESQANRIVLDSPILSEGLFKAILQSENMEYVTHIIDLNYNAEEGLENALKRICKEAEQAIRNKVVLLVISDRKISQDTIPIHALLATGYLNNYLINNDLRALANIIVETATARDSHHMACLIGSGATLIYPYLAYDIIAHKIQNRVINGLSSSQALKNYQKSIDKGLYKIMSKMGISTIASYRGSQLFEVIGINSEICHLAFPRMPSRIEGLGYVDLQCEQAIKHEKAFNNQSEQSVGGVLKYMQDGEYHSYNPNVVQLLQKAVNSGLESDYSLYRDAVNKRQPATLRDLLTLKVSEANNSVNSNADNKANISEVESVEKLFKRFDSAAMSLGALSPEAHETLAQAMNELGGRSNSGEGGEDEARFNTNKVSKIKQIASGRFGVTPHYLMNADVLQIKIAQGAKPGEGGQLPGDKVNDLIARLRYSSKGVTLISPPPHHDIYSIEDLAQLIFDLKQVNPKALVSVKLVSEPGVGTIATGVTKAYADMITISGYDGGTGASPLTSIRYAGSPWELGLAETHQALCENDLRDKVILQVDGGLKTGLDIIKAAILGAESFGFGTGPMIAMGCKYLRICHLNSCATGIATQHEILRDKHFTGDKDKVKNYFRFVAEEVRQTLAWLGYNKLDDIIGKTELLQQIDLSAKPTLANIDLSALLAKSSNNIKRSLTDKIANNTFDKGALNQSIIQKIQQYVKSKTAYQASFNINNTDRSVGATLSGLISQIYGRAGLPENTIRLVFHGSAGQSFGVWNANGLSLTLHGEANDFVGKGMAGGEIVLCPNQDATFDTHLAPIAGNTCLYGATGGSFYAAGQAGERFAVRNSGATTVIEGAGDHCCEYMTGGVVVVLGKVGANFGAGMTGGVAFVLDEQNTFYDRCNKESVELYRITTTEMREHSEFLEKLIGQHAKKTQSEFSKQLLDDFAYYATKFWLVAPKSQQLSKLISQYTQAA